jgi:hypothetical protein
MSPLGIKNGDGYDWGAVAADLSRMMTLADEKANRKTLNAGKMKPERVDLFEKLLALMEQYRRKNQYE